MIEKTSTLEDLPKTAERPGEALVVIVGPTASGKSALAVELARRFAGEVVACDSTQVYRGFDIGTAKPTAEERQGIAHHMLDLIGPEELCTAGEYRTRATEVLRELRQRSKLPILTAGTGLYLRALLEGLADAPVRSAELRERLEQAAGRGRDYLHRMLRRLDPAAAARIAPNDRQKLVRALEICLLAGRPLTEVHRAGRARLEGYRPIKIGLSPPREALYARIERRTAAMIERGWEEEVAALVKGRVLASAKPFEFIGYRELRARLEGKMSLAEAMGAIAQATRRYAKRQLTWFRKEPGVRWFAGFGDEPETTTAAVSEVERSLRGAAHPAAPSAGRMEDGR